MSETINRLKKRLANRSLVLVGLMGSGKSTLGKQIARILDLRFCDSDHEIEAVSQMTVAELFTAYGEQEFRDLERRVIFRLLNEEPQVLATGGGAFMNPETRRAIAEHGLSLWLKADIDLLMEHVSRKNHRPLLHTENPRNVMERLMNERHAVYAEADITVQIDKTRQNAVICDTIKMIDHYLTAQEEAMRNEN